MCHNLLTDGVSILQNKGAEGVLVQSNAAVPWCTSFSTSHRLEMPAVRLKLERTDTVISKRLIYMQIQ